MYERTIELCVIFFTVDAIALYIYNADWFNEWYNNKIHFDHMNIALVINFTFIGIVIYSVLFWITMISHVLGIQDLGELL